MARNAPYRANISYSAAQAALAGGDLAGGVERLQAVFENYGGTATAWKALDLLSQRGATYDGLQRGRAAFNAGDYQAAIDAFNEYTTTHELAAIPADLFLTLGRAYRQIGNSDAAAVAFQTIVDQYPQDPLFGDALLEQGRTRFLAGDSPAAIQIYLSIADTYPLFEQTAGVALWRAAYLYGTNGDTALSRQVFTRLADSYPGHEFTVNGLFNAASAAVRDEEWAIAENLYARIASLANGQDQAAAYLWMGRDRAATGAMKSWPLKPSSWRSRRRLTAILRRAQATSASAFSHLTRPIACDSTSTTALSCLRPNNGCGRLSPLKRKARFGA